MVTGRRELLRLFAFVAAAGACPTCAAAAGKAKQARALPRGSSRNLARTLAAGCTVAGSALRKRLQSQLSTSTGNQFVDAGFARTRLLLNQAYAASPAFAFFDDSASANAYATPADVIPWERGTGSVLFGIRLMTEEIAADPATWGSALTLIMAHEWAHIKQYMLTGPLPAPAAELHGDFIAGWFLGLLNRQSGGMSINPNSAAASVFNKGDFAFNSPQHHGTPQQRVGALAAGYELAMSPSPGGIDDAFYAGAALLRIR